MGRSRSLFARLGLLCCLLVPPVVHTGCVQNAAYQIRMEQAARKHVYDVSRTKLLAAVKHVAEEDGWSIEEGDGDGGPDLTGKARERNGRKERLVIVLVKDADGFRVEADLEVDLKTANGKQHSTMHASALEIAVFSELDPKAADKAKVKAKAQAKEDAKMIRACARRAVDTATETED